MEVHAPWPEHFPEGRLLDPEHRHITLAFFGHIPFEPLEKHLGSIPKPEFRLGRSGCFDKCLIFPHVVAWHVHAVDLEGFQSRLSKWLQELGYPLEKREWNPHVTLCREPFKGTDWMMSFKPLPLYISTFHLYESLGHSKYSSVWSYPIAPPFEELDHTADIAFQVKGKTLEELYQHAITALAFKEPAFLDYKREYSLKTLDDVIIGLNEMIARMDIAIGSPFKAVSFHGNIKEKEGLLVWEMIVDI